jgi:hypothetical protein
LENPNIETKAEKVHLAGRIPRVKVSGAEPLLLAMTGPEAKLPHSLNLSGIPLILTPILI